MSSIRMFHCRFSCRTAIRPWWPAALLGLLGLLAGGLPPAQAGTVEPIRIGSVLTLSGPGAALGEPELKTLQLYVERLNAAGGLLGRPLRLIHVDDGGELAKVDPAFRRLLDAERVDVLIGGTTSSASLAALPLVERAEVPFLSLAGSVLIVEPAKKWVFKTAHTDRMACDKVFADLRARGLTRVALLSEASGYGRSGRFQCLARAAASGVQVVLDDSHDPKEADFSAPLARIGASDAQALLVLGVGASSARITRAVHAAGLKLALYHTHSIGSKAFIEAAGDAAEGVRFPAAALIIAAQLPEADPQKRVALEYTQAYTAAYGGSVSTFGGHAYDALMQWAEAVRRAGSVEPDAVRRALEATHGYVGTGGIVHYAPTDHLGLDATAFRMIEIRNGDWRLID